MLYLSTAGMHYVSCILIFALLLFIVRPSFPGTGRSDASLRTTGGWAATYWVGINGHAKSIHQTLDGGCVVAGEMDSFTTLGKKLWVLKLKPDGTVEWQKTYRGGDYNNTECIQQTLDGGYIVTGYTLSLNPGSEDINAWVLKLGSDGTVEWQKTHGGVYPDWARSIQQTSDGGYIVTGFTVSFGAGVEDIWVLKLRPNGMVEWQKTYGGVKADGAVCIQQTSDGGYIVAGYTYSFGAGKKDFWVLKLMTNGTIDWQKTYGGSDNDSMMSIQQTSDSGYIMAGRTDSFGVGGADLWVLKLSPNGTVEWQKTYGGGDSEGTRFIQQTSDNGYIVAAETRSFSDESSDIWVLKLSTHGTIEWQKVYGGARQDSPESISQTSDGGYIVAGYTTSFSWASKLLVLRLRPDGSISPSYDSTYDFMRDTSIIGKDSTAIVNTTNVSPRESNANPRDTYPVVKDTSILAKFLFK